MKIAICGSNQDMYPEEIVVVESCPIKCTVRDLVAEAWQSNSAERDALAGQTRPCSIGRIMKALASVSFGGNIPS